MTVPPRQMIAECLRDGRRWQRSFQQVKRTLSAMIREGEVNPVSSGTNAAKNMVELTGRGWKIYFGENLLVTRLDNFAELLADGMEPQDAGRVLRLTRGEVASAMRRIKGHLGPQAA